MSDKRYPTRMHEVLGVELGERFQIKGQTTWYDQNFFVDENGDVRREGWSPPFDRAAVYLINHPERITRRPRLTEEQVKRLRALIALEAMYLAKNKDGSVEAFTNKPTKNALYWNGKVINPYVFYLSIVGTCLSDLVSWSDPAPLDIVQTLRDAGVEIEEDK